MKIVFACRRSPASIFIARALHERGRLDGIIVEEGARARLGKLRRTLWRSPFMALPSRVLDLIFLWRMDRVVGRYLAKSLNGGASRYSVDPAPILCDDINDQKSVAALKKLAPDVLIVFGTAIVGEAVFALGIRHILNIHTGIVPQYRGVHSEFWALSRGDLDSIGATILHLDHDIDAGMIALQRRVLVAKADRLSVVKERNTRLAATLINEAIDLLVRGDLPAIPQAEHDAAARTTPHFTDWANSKIAI